MDPDSRRDTEGSRKESERDQDPDRPEDRRTGEAEAATNREADPPA